MAEREAAVSALAAVGTGGLFFWVLPGMQTPHQLVAHPWEGLGQQGARWVGHML